MKKIILPIVLAAPLLAGCMTDGMGTKQGFGTLGGAAAGGLAGSQIGKGNGNLAAVAIGTLLGAFAGSEIGASLDRADQVYAVQALQRFGTASTGNTIGWQNPQSGNWGQITPVSLPRRTSAGFCRDYDQTIYIGGRAQQAYGRACQQPNGSWQIVN